MKISITGDVFVVTSSITKENYEFAKKYCPDILTIKDDKDNAVFGIDYKPEKSSVSKFGVTFGGSTRDDNGYLTATIQIPASVEDAKAFAADCVGCASAYLEKLEGTFDETVGAKIEERNTLIENIVVV